MAGMFPAAPDAPTYWRNIIGGVDAISEMPAGRVDQDFYDPESWRTPAYDRVYAWRGGFVDEFATFDPIRYGVMPNAVDTIEPDQLLALRIASAAVDDAGGPDRLPDRERVGVVFGRGGYIGPGMSRLSQRVSTSRQVMTILKQLVPSIDAEKLNEVRQAFSASFGPDAPGSAIGIVPNLTASRVANRLDLCGPAYTVDAACASSLLAVEQGIRDLHSGRCDMVLAGGVHHSHDVTLWSVFCQLRALSPSQQIRPFDRRADGLLIGEGTGVIALKRLDDALRDDDRIYAVIRGTGVASDGRATSLMAPQSSGQVLAVRQAWRAAGLDPTAAGAIGVLEAHGTATPAGDAAELATMREVFGDDPASGEIILGSVKSMIGHAMPAAGVAGIIKAAYALHHAMLPPTLHCEQPHELLDGSRFRMLEEPESWESTGPRRAGVNAFGFGGINAHVLLEEAPTQGWGTGRARRHRSVDQAGVSAAAEEVVLRLAAPTPAAMTRLLEGAASELAEGGLHGPGGQSRLALVDPTPERLALARKIVSRGVPWRGRNRVWWTASPVLGGDPVAAGQIAFVFPGIERPLDSTAEDVAAHFGLPGASDERTGFPIVDQTLEILTVGALLSQALGRVGIAPSLVAGHSVGEWAAMLVSGLMPGDSLDAFLGSLRGQNLEIPGAVFGALSCSAQRAREAIAELSVDDRDRISVSHDNCPEQSIVCGDQEVVARLLEQLRGRGVLGQVLPFRSGFHSPMLEPFIDPFRKGMADVPLGKPSFPVWSATTLEPYPHEASAIRALLVRHLLEPVRFRELVERLHAAGVRAFVQLGPGSVAGFVDDTLRGRDYTAISAYASGEVSGIAQLHRVAASLWVEGADPDFGPLAKVAAPPATDQASPSGSSKSSTSVSLDLCLPLIRLGADVEPLDLANSGSRMPSTAAAGDHPLLAELDAVLQAASASSSAVIDAWALAPSARKPDAPTPTVAPEQAAVPALSEAASTRVVTRPISVDAMPYLIDHGLFPQRPGWPIVADWGPVVPMTTMIEMMLEEARAFAPGRIAVGIESITALTWLTATPPTSVTIRSAADGPDRVRVTLVGHTHGTVLLADAYPEAPTSSSEPMIGEAESDLAADRLYADGWLFHGPSFQGITAIDGMAENGMRTTITTPPAPGALLDNAGQAVGYWLGRHAEIAKLAFPRAIGRINFYAAPPAPGDEVGCTLWVREVLDRSIRADLELRSADGQVWAAIENWEDYRFSTDDSSWPVIDKPAINCASTEQADGWCLIGARWEPSLRQMMMRRYLTECERGEYAALLPRAEGAWLLGRIAAKDAARRWLWARGAAPIFPAEIVVANDPSGKPTATGPHGEPLALSLAHSGDLAVAMVRSGEPGDWAPGIDIELIEERDASFEAVAFIRSERALLDLIADDRERPVWIARFWAAKEAVSKARGTGLRGRPQDFVVAQAEADGRLRVEHGDSGFDVASTVPDDGAHVVAWVSGAPFSVEPDGMELLETTRSRDAR
jgi:acyl transferase domain-containing protein/phosphopantetheinyl transferase